MIKAAKKSQHQFKSQTSRSANLARVLLHPLLLIVQPGFKTETTDRKVMFSIYLFIFPLRISSIATNLLGFARKVTQCSDNKYVYAFPAFQYRFFIFVQKLLVFFLSGWEMLPLARQVPKIFNKAHAIFSFASRSPPVNVYICVCASVCSHPTQSVMPQCLLEIYASAQDREHNMMSQTDV